MDIEPIERRSGREGYGITAYGSMAWCEDAYTDRRALIAEVHRLREALHGGADRLDNLIHALKLPARDALHLEGLRATLPEILSELVKAAGPDL